MDFYSDENFPLPVVERLRELGHNVLRACFKIGRGPAARDFGRGRGGEAGASPQRAVTAEPTKAAAKRTAALRVFAEKALWLRCSSLTDRWRVCSLVTPCQRAFSAKTGPRRILKQALSIQESGKADQSVPDAEVLVFARAQKRALLTLNRRHFMRLHQANPDHFGILVCKLDLDFQKQAQRIHSATQGYRSLAGLLLRINREQ